MSLIWSYTGLYEVCMVLYWLFRECKGLIKDNTGLQEAYTGLQEAYTGTYEAYMRLIRA